MGATMARRRMEDAQKKKAKELAEKKANEQKQAEQVAIPKQRSKSK